MQIRSRWAEAGLGVAVPLLLIALILSADAAEGPKTAYVGVLAVVPMLAAVFASPLLTAMVGVITWLSAFAFGQLASDGNVAAQKVRLIIIALVGVAAVGAAFLRTRRERALVSALDQAATAEQQRLAAETDHLTGLANRQGFMLRLAARDSSQVMTLALIDCDDLKSVNDRFGHLAGDGYLSAIAGRLAGDLSRQDLIARWGGDEFVIVQAGGPDAAMPTMQRLLLAINGAPVSVAGQLIDASVSIGVAEWTPSAGLDSALAAADRALYEAKAAGRNRVVRAD